MVTHSRPWIWASLFHLLGWLTVLFFLDRAPAPVAVPDVLTVRAVQLVGPDGVVRLTLQATDRGAVLVANDPSAGSFAQLQVDPEHAALTMSTEEGTATFGFDGFGSAVRAVVPDPDRAVVIVRGDRSPAR